MSKQNTVTTTTSVGGKTTDLKNKFTAGSIPLDTDFSELIDIAECGRRAIGQSADQSDNSVGAGLTLDTDTNTATMGKLSVLPKPGSGITADSSGVGINWAVILPKGMIMMYYDNGSHVAPTGWAICDGTNGTPDLTMKFVMGGKWAGETNGLTLNGDENARHAAGSVLGANANIKNSGTDAHILTINEMPAHQHDIGGVQHPDFYVNYQSGGTRGGDDFKAAGSIGEGDEPDRVHALNTGGGGGHSHTLTQSPHSHDVTVDIPYYTLMYIMKL